MNMLEQWLSKTLNRLNLVDSMEQLKGFTRLSYSEEEWKQWMPLPKLLMKWAWR